MMRLTGFVTMLCCAVLLFSVHIAMARTFSMTGGGYGADHVAAGSGNIRIARQSSADSSKREFVAAKLYDLELMDQDGNKVSFKNDVIGDKVAVIIPFYTNCPTAYPILIFILTKLQDMLGERLGKTVVLASVTVDPRTDTPMRLKAYAHRQKAKPGWIFLTGDSNNLGQVLCGVGALFSSSIEEHNHIPITIVGSARGEWRRFHGFPTPEQLLAQIEESLAKSRQP